MVKIGIEFLENIVEPTLPIIRLTKSKNKTTGTATFIFIRPEIFFLIKKLNLKLEKMSLIWGKKKISTFDIQIKFYKGEPFLIKSILLFKNSKDWFDFLMFMNSYCQETGLSYSEILN